MAFAVLVPTIAALPALAQPATDLAGVALRVARLTRTPPENRGPDHGRLSACELAVRDAPRDVACGGAQVARQSAIQAGGSGDVGAHCPLLGIVESSLRMVGRRDSQQCHMRRPPDRRATPATDLGEYFERLPPLAEWI